MDELTALREELEHYRHERQQIRDLVGQVGGRSHRRRDWAINLTFLVLVVGFFAFDVLRHAAGLHVPGLPPLMLLEVALLLVSLKIIWMIHLQTKVNHFQFWILNSIELRVGQMSRRLAELEAAGRPGPSGHAAEQDPDDGRAGVSED